MCNEVGRISSCRLFRPGGEVHKTRWVSILLVIGSHRWILGKGVWFRNSVCKGFMIEWMKEPKKPQGMEGGGTALPSWPGEVGFTENFWCGGHRAV